MKKIIEQTIVKRGPGRPRKVIMPQTFNKIKIEKNGDYWNIREYPTLLKKYPISLGNFCLSPTSNCQLFSYLSFNELLTSKLNKKEIINVLQLISLRANKKIILIDVKKQYVNKIKKLFTKNQILSETNYISTNDSNMNIFIVKIWDKFNINVSINNENIKIKKQIQ